MAITVPDFLQTKQYSAAASRRMFLDADLQPGAVTSADMLVGQRGAGANMSVDVAAGSAWAQGTFSSRQGLYHLYNDAVVNLAIASNSSGNPRIDQVVLHVYDTTDGGSAQDIGALEVVQGTPTASAQISSPGGANYRSGAASIPASSIRLADIAVANGAASITTANINDRRQLARGNRGYNSASVNTTTASASAVLITGSPSLTMECSGKPLLVTHNIVLAHSAGGGNWIETQLFDNGAATSSIAVFQAITTASDNRLFTQTGLYTPTAGRHVFQIGWRTSAGTASTQLNSFSTISAVELL